MCMKPSLTSVLRIPDTHGSDVTFMPVESTETAIPCKKNNDLYFFGRLGIGEPEDLSMR